MKKLKDFKLKDRRVLVRADFNVPLDKRGGILDNYRLKVSVPTIKELKKKKAKIILMSHLGRPSAWIPKYSLKQIAPELESLLKIRVKVLPEAVGVKAENAVKRMKPGQILLLENLRFYPEETKNDSGFAEKLARLGNIYINDAFSVSHRSHASVVRLPELLPSVPGPLFEKELEVLSKVKDKPKKPLVIIVGGKKFAKIESLPKLLKRSNYLLMNGYLSEAVLAAKGILIGRDFPEDGILKAVKKVDLTNRKLHLPKDVLISLEKDWTYKRIAGLGTIRREERVYDIGVETIDLYSKIIKKAGTIFWAGPLGFFEEERFENGTREIGEKIIRNYKAFKVVGGGDTVSAVKKFGWMDKFDHISVGGSAMLKFVCGEKLPGIEALE